MALLEIRNLLFSYDSRFENKPFSLAIDKWEINEGDFISIIGPNGSGKSTLLKILARILAFKKGIIKLGGVELPEISIKEYAKQVAYVPQSAHSLFSFSVYEIVMMGRTPYLGLMGFENEDDKKIVDEALELMEITHLKNKGINEISGGEAQRVIIARALAQKAKLILLDEPNSHLDIEHQLSIFNLLTTLNKEQNITFVSVSHDLNLVGIYSKDVVFVQNGKITLHGKKHEVLTEENINKVFRITSKVTYSPDLQTANIIVQPFIGRHN